jgi:hypothetical protein
MVQIAYKIRYVTNTVAIKKDGYSDTTYECLSRRYSHIDQIRVESEFAIINPRRDRYVLRSISMS